MAKAEGNLARSAGKPANRSGIYPNGSPIAAGCKTCQLLHAILGLLLIIGLMFGLLLFPPLMMKGNAGETTDPRMKPIN